jgi:DNA topoisomerase-1
MAETIETPHIAARLAHLRYVHDTQPGISRVKAPGGFAYRHPDGTPVTDAETLERIRRMVLPPAYEDVWICPLANGHLQATGRDARGRKQYRYHERWRSVRDAAKYDRMLEFGAALPIIRRQVEADLKRHGLPREKIVAAVVHLLEKTCIRVGNDEYAHSNDSYGLTTMLEQHVDVTGATVRFHFRGKSGKTHDVALRDPRMARLIHQCQELPGHELFQYVDHAGTPHHIHSGDVNDYLRAATGQDFTAKDFRTWAGTVFCALCLAEGEAATSPTHGKRLVAEAIKRVSRQLGNTPAICRKCYVHPAVIAAFEEGAMVLERAVASGQAKPGIDPTNLSGDESAVLRFLKHRMNRVDE